MASLESDVEYENISEIEYATNDSSADQGAADALDHVDSDTNPMDDILGLVAKPQSNETALINNAQLELVDSLALQALDKVGHKVHPSAAAVIANHSSRSFKRSPQGDSLDTSTIGKVIDRMKEYPTPGNLQKELTPFRANDCTFQSATPLVKKINSEGHMADVAICKSQVINSLLLEGLIDMGSKVTDDGRQQLTNIIKLVGSGVEFLALARDKLNEARRINILSSVNPNYKNIGDNTRPGDGLLFGKDLESAVNTVDTTSKLAKKLTKPQQQQKGDAFLGRGRTRGSFHHHSRGRPRYDPYRQERQQHQSHQPRQNQYQNRLVY